MMLQCLHKECFQWTRLCLESFRLMKKEIFCTLVVWLLVAGCRLLSFVICCLFFSFFFSRRFKVDPRNLLEDGIRKELVRNITVSMNNILVFPSGRIEAFEGVLEELAKVLESCTVLFCS